MRTTAVFVMICSFLASACCAQRSLSRVRATASRISTVAEARLLKPVGPVLRVTASTPPGQTADSAASTAAPAGNPAYKTGNGVVLTLCNMLDAATSSELRATNVELSSSLLSNMQSKDPSTYMPIIVSSASPLLNNVAFAWFKGLPPEEHSYLLTFKITPLTWQTSTATIKDCLSGYVGSSLFDGNSNTALISPNTGEWRVWFNYAASDGSIGADLRWTNKPTDRWGELEFYYVQLQQLD